MYFYSKASGSSKPMVIWAFCYLSSAVWIVTFRFRRAWPPGPGPASFDGVIWLSCICTPRHARLFALQNLISSGWIFYYFFFFLGNRVNISLAALLFVFFRHWTCSFNVWPFNFTNPKKNPAKIVFLVMPNFRLPWIMCWDVGWAWDLRINLWGWWSECWLVNKRGSQACSAAAS